MMFLDATCRGQDWRARMVPRRWSEYPTEAHRGWTARLPTGAAVAARRRGPPLGSRPGIPGLAQACRGVDTHGHPVAPGTPGGPGFGAGAGELLTGPPSVTRALPSPKASN